MPEPQPTSHARRKRELIEVIRMQRVAFESAMDNARGDSEQRAWMRTYNELSERRRILSGKPLPGSLAPGARPQSARKLRMMQASMLASMQSAGDDAQARPDEADKPPW